MKETLKEITNEFLHHLNKENNFKTLKKLDEKFNEKAKRLIYVIFKMENKREILLKKLSDLEKNIEKTRFYAANQMRIIGKDEIENTAKLKIIDGKLNLILEKENKNNATKNKKTN